MLKTDVRNFIASLTDLTKTVWIHIYDLKCLRILGYLNLKFLLLARIWTDIILLKKVS